MWIFRASARLLILPLLVAACGGGGGKPTGPPAPVPDTVRTFRGRIAYFVTGPQINGRDANGRIVPVAGFVEPTLPRGAPRATVEVVSTTGALLGSTTTDGNGNYTITINFGKVPAPPVRVRAVARATLSGGTDLRVLPDITASAPYEILSAPTTDPDLLTTTVDISVPLNQGAAAFHILGVLFPGLSTIRGGVVGTVPDLDVLWKPGNGAVSSLTVVSPQLARLLVAGGITGNDASNQDCWDDPKLVRLVGEYFLAYFSNSVAPPGAPDDSPLVPSAAWREGFLDFWACAARGTPEYWDSEGIRAAGRVVRFFNVESFFDPALGSLGPDDPNVYQDDTNIGVGSRFTIAEVLWDILDGGAADEDTDDITVPLFLMLSDLGELSPGTSYPYLHTGLERFVANLSFTAVQAHVLLSSPEDQNAQYPATVATAWPRPLTDPLRLDGLIAVPYDQTYGDAIDNASPDVNPEIGLTAQRYFQVNLEEAATLDATVDPATLRVEILDLSNNVIAGGTGVASAALEAGVHVLRVLPAGAPVNTSFDLRVRLTP